MLKSSNEPLNLFYLISRDDTFATLAFPDGSKQKKYKLSDIQQVPINQTDDKYIYCHIKMAVPMNPLTDPIRNSYDYYLNFLKINSPVIYNKIKPLKYVDEIQTLLEDKCCYLELLINSDKRDNYWFFNIPNKSF